MRTHTNILETCERMWSTLEYKRITGNDRPDQWNTLKNFATDWLNRVQELLDVLTERGYTAKVDELVEVQRALVGYANYATKQVKT